MSQNMQLLIGGVDYSQYLEQSTYYVTQNWSRQGDTATFYLTDEHADGALNVVVPALSTIELIDNGLNQVIFSGLTTMPQLKYLGPNLASWQVDCVDWTYLTDRAPVQGDFRYLSADQIIKSLVTEANCGITTNHVMPGPQLPRIKIIYYDLTTALKKISNAASTSDKYGWYIDENHDLHWFNQLQAPASGVTFTDNPATLAALGPDGSGNPAVSGYDWQSYWYFWDGTAVHNQATVRGGTYSNSQTDYFVGNGSTTAFPLTYTPDSTVSTAGLTLSVGGTSKTISVATGGSASTQWAITQNAVGQWYLITVTDPAPASGQIIQLSYTYKAPVIARVQDNASISRFSSLPNRGVFGVYIADTALNDIRAAQVRGLQEINTFSEPEERVQFTTTANWTGHVRAGQTCTFQNAVTPDSLRGNAPGINDTFLITQVRINGQAGLYRTYYVTAVRISTGSI
ncbi:hypothetical protein [Streptomyces sp. NPDC093261]|uniref:hypothetical protein n=1 Tax=Streptomyces sp. NPDC093261 TaxID=3366037 RepID=UPI0037F255CF